MRVFFVLKKKSIRCYYYETWSVNTLENTHAEKPRLASWGCFLVDAAVEAHLARCGEAALGSIVVSGELVFLIRLELALVWVQLQYCNQMWWHRARG